MLLFRTEYLESFLRQDTGWLGGIFSVKGDPFQEGLLLVEEEPMGTKASLQGALPPTSQSPLSPDQMGQSLQEPYALISVFI